MTAQAPDLAIADIKMARMDGMDLLAKLRKHSQLPVIFLTSKDDEVDEVLGLRMGADDYITKPFSQRLLIERIRSLLRRQELLRDKRPAESEAAIVRGELILDPARHVCTWKGQEVALTVTEFLLLKALAQQPRSDRTGDGMNTDVDASPIPPERAQAPPSPLGVASAAESAPAAATPSRPARRRRFSPLTLKILAVNVLALVVLAAGFFFVDDYRRSLIESKLQAMTVEARLIATAPGAAATVTVDADGGPEDQPARGAAPQRLRGL